MSIELNPRPGYALIETHWDNAVYEVPAELGRWFAHILLSADTLTRNDRRFLRKWRLTDREVTRRSVKSLSSSAKVQRERGSVNV